MKLLSTDDEPARNQYVWFGTPDVPLPTGARLPAIGWAILLIPTFTVLAFTLTPFVDLLPFHPAIVFLAHAAGALVVGGGAAILLIRAVGRKVTPETPLRYWWLSWKGEINTPRPVSASVETTTEPADLWVEHQPGTARTTTPRITFDD